MVRREVPDRVVAPVVGQPALEQERLGHVLVHRQQFHRGHAEPGQVVGDRLVREPGVGAAQVLGHVRVAHGEPLDVRLVDDRVRVAAPRRLVVAPLEPAVGDDAARHVPGRVQRARRVRVRRVVVEHLGPERHLTVHRPRVRVEQQLGRVAAQPAARVPRPVHPESVGLPGAGTRHEPVPDAVVILRQPDPALSPALIEQAHLDALGDAGSHREIGSPVTQRRPQRRRPARKCIRHPPHVTHPLPPPPSPRPASTPPRPLTPPRRSAPRPTLILCPTQNPRITPN